MLCDKNNSILCIDVLLDFISSECPSASIREIYGKLRELIAWGYIFSIVKMANGQIESNLNDFICQLENAMQMDNAEEFADLWQAFIEQRLKLFYKEFPARL